MHPGRPSTPSSDTWMRVGVGLLGAGVVASVVTLVPFLTGGDPLPVTAYLLSLLAPVGLAVVLVALWRRARGRRSRLDAAISGDVDAQQPSQHAR